jgi:nucleoside-triphosphatase
LHGFITKRLLLDGADHHGVYIMPAADPWNATGQMQQLASIKENRTFEVNLDAFDVFGVKLLTCGQNGLIVMDELGFLESNANRFNHLILELLEGDTPILGVIKTIKTPFLDQIRANNKVSVIEVTEANRDQLYPELLRVILYWNGMNSFSYRTAHI